MPIATTDALMSARGYRFHSWLLKTLVAFKRPDVPPWVALRNVVAVVLPLALGVATGYREAGLGISVGALVTMFSDQPGPYRKRLTLLMLASAATATMTLCGLLVAHALLPTLLATAICGFFAGMLVVFGPDMARVGMNGLILLAITAWTPAPWRSALEASAMTFCGGLLLTLFSIAAWPLMRYRPERDALAGVYRELAGMARRRLRDASAAPALTDAMTTLQYTLLGRHRARGRAMEAFGVLLELAERIRLELTALAEMDDDGTPAPAHGGDADHRRDAAHVLDTIAEGLEQGKEPAGAEPPLAELRARAQASQADHPHTAHRQALIGQLAAAVRNAAWAGGAGELRAEASEQPLPAALRSGSAWQTWRANLSWRSVAMRHALRMAACLVLATLLAKLLKLPHGYWLPMTVAIVLRADFAATFSFGLLRIVGTLCGLLLTTVLLYVAPDTPWAHLALMAVLCFGFRYLATAHYGAAVTALTGTVVILLSFEGVNPSTAVIDRVIATVLGSGMALLAYLAWPTWERGRTRAALAGMLEAYACYLDALAWPEQVAARLNARTRARVARSNAQASVDRLHAEPATPPALAELAEALLANGNRLARTAMALDALGDGTPSRPAAMNGFVATCADAVHSLADALRQQHAADGLPDLRALQQATADALRQDGDPATAEALIQLGDRLTNNINTLAHVLENREKGAVSGGTGV